MTHPTAELKYDLGGYFDEMYHDNALYISDLFGANPAASRMAETSENQHKGIQEECVELTSSSLIQSACSQEVDQKESGTSVEDEIQTFEFEEQKVDLEEQPVRQKKKSLTSSFKKRFRYSLR